MKKVIITGATGQDGSYLIDYLLNHTDNIIIAAVRRTSQAILNNLEHNLNNHRLKFVTVDLTDGESVKNLIKNEKPDYFINLGAQTYVADSWKSPVAHMNTNALTVIYILESIKEYVPFCRFYSAGSSEQWGNVEYAPQDEKHPMKPRSVYGVSKCAAALLTKVYRESYGLYAVHGILFNHESPRRQKYFVTRKITSGIADILKSKTQDIPAIELGNLDARRDWSHAQDFVEGIWMMVNQEVYNKNIAQTVNNINSIEEQYKIIVPQLKEYILSSDECHSIREFVELSFSFSRFLIESKFGKGDYKWIGKGLDEQYIYELHDKSNSFVLVKINKDFFRPAEVDLLLGNSKKVREELGWAPKISFSELVYLMIQNDIKNI